MQPTPMRTAAERREIRVFISSTFRDMQEEREELVKQVFPQLRRLCESRGVTWGEVDLRWGVPDEAKAEGKVLPLCLQEIEQCRPYFLGLVGERYGWVPEEFSEDLLEAHPWLKEHRGKSITALEILHGVLDSPQMAEHTFFYFRDPAYAAEHPGFTEEIPALREQLSQLKSDIRKCGVPVREAYASPKQLGEWVLRDLTNVIETLYSEREIPDQLERVALDHEDYSASRRSVYIGRPEYMDQLNLHVEGDGPPLVIIGESGGGKSALLANWSHVRRREHPETPVLVHFIGAAPDSADWMAMLRRLLGEFGRKMGVRVEIPDKPDALREVFANALDLVASRGRLVLVLDGLNQIEDRDGAADLIWLPPLVPANVRLVVSVLPGRAWEELKRRGWPVMTVEPLTHAERERLIIGYLRRYSKQLDVLRCRRIAAAPQTGNSLYLSTLLNELRLFGRHEDLDRRIDWYLEADDPVGLFGKVITRWEQDYEEQGSDSEGMVGDSLMRIWGARRGFSEVELLETLGNNAGPLPRALWTPMYLAAGDALLNRGGLLTFSHNYLREAVRIAYVPTEEREREVHRALSSYFFDIFGQDARNRVTNLRAIDEVAWQLHKSAEWRSLARLLSNPAIFDVLWEEDQYEIKDYWTQIERNCPLRMEQVYQWAIDNPRVYPDSVLRIGALLSDSGRIKAARVLFARLVRHYRDSGNRKKLRTALAFKARLLQTHGDLDSAMALREEQQRLCRELGDKKGLANALDGQASILKMRGDLDGAMALYKEEERHCREMGLKRELAESLGGQASILQLRGERDGAMTLYKEEEGLCREVGYKHGLQESLTGQASILEGRGDLDGAMALLKKNEALYRKYGDTRGLGTTLGNQALILETGGDLDGAMALYKEVEALYRKLGDKHGLGATLGNQSLILRTRGDLDGAMELCKEQERLCTELGDKNGLQHALGHQANILDVRGDLKRSLELNQEKERLCRELGNQQGLSIALANQANLLTRMEGRMIEAKQLASEALRIATERDYHQLMTYIESISEAIATKERGAQPNSLGNL